MNATQDIVFDKTGQELLYVPSERPSVATVEVFENVDGDDATAEAATTGSVSVDAVDTTFDNDSGYGESDPRVCLLAATTNIAVGERYLATNGDGASEECEVKEIDSGNGVTLRHPLQNLYESGATFVGLKMTISVDPTWVAAKENLSDGANPNPRYRVRWSYTGGGELRVSATYFDLVRYTGTHDVTGLDVDDMFPGFLDLLPTRYRSDQGRSLIASAYRAVKLDMLADCKPDQSARHAEVIDDLTAHKANEMAQEVALQRGGGSLEAVEAARSGYTQRYDQLIRSPKIPFANDSGGGAREATRAPLFSR